MIWNNWINNYSLNSAMLKNHAHSHTQYFDLSFKNHSFKFDVFNIFYIS